MPYRLFFASTFEVTPVIEVDYGKHACNGRKRRGFASIREVQKYVRSLEWHLWYGDYTPKELAMLSRRKTENLKHFDDAPIIADACVCVGEIWKDYPGHGSVHEGYFWLKWEA